MDGRQFDTWTRSLAAQLSRRRTIKAMAGTVLAGLVTRVTVRQAEACTEADFACSPGECCVGLVCKSTSPNVCGPCRGAGEPCVASYGECCSGSCTSKWYLFFNSSCDAPPSGKSHARKRGKKKKRRGGGHGHG
jgi:hypothetical protein